MRVIAGELGGRRLVAPPGAEVTRPTTDRVREAMFNALASRGGLTGSKVADLFAGSGALGIEALSRGAEHCTFVERDRAALDALRANLDDLGLTRRSRVVAGDVFTVAAGLGEMAVVFADPPYEFDDWDRLLGALDADLVLAESDRDLPDLASYTAQRHRRYGRTRVTWFERVP